MLHISSSDMDLPDEASSPSTQGVPDWPLHFWSPTTSVLRTIKKIYQRGSHYPYEDVVWHAWEGIFKIYFPGIEDANGLVWAVRREAYRVSGAPVEGRADITTITSVIDDPAATVPGQPPEVIEMDYLWLRCKAAIHDTPAGWNDLMAEMVARLNSFQRKRPLNFILAIGYKFMFFCWDPENSISPQPQYQIWKPDRSGTWLVDPRVKALQCLAWIDTVTGYIATENAMELDSWTLASSTPGSILLKNSQTLCLIEVFLLTIRGMASDFQGLEPALV